jgi:hypothetical protein
MSRKGLREGEQYLSKARCNVRVRHFAKWDSSGYRDWAAPPNAMPVELVVCSRLFIPDSKQIHTEQIGRC